MKNTDTTTLLTPIVRIFERYHLTIFIVVLVGGLMTAVIMLSGILSQASDTSTITPTTGNTTFDQATIDRLNRLHTRDDTSAGFVLPAGRTSPFYE